MRLSIIVLLSLPLTASADVSFAPVLVAEHVYDGGWEHFVGGGVAVFDCDDDDLPELYAAGGSNPAQLYRNMSDGAVKFAAQTPATLALSGVTEPIRSTLTVTA